MSGGSLNYAYSQLQSVAEEVLHRSENNLHKAFAKHLFKVADALHDLEWVLSSDYGYGDEVEAIRKVITKSEEIECAKEEAQKLISDLQEIIKSVG